MPDDFSDDTWPQAELNSAYAQLDHLQEVAQALYCGIAMIVQALEGVTTLAWLTPVAREHLRLALREARQALRMAEPVLEEETHYE